MQLALNLNGEEKIFTINFVSGKHFRKVNEFDETIDYSDIGIEEMDTLVGFVCEVFGNQFDINEFYEGIPSHKVISTITDVFVRVRTGKSPEELEKKKDEEGNEQGK